MKEMHCFVLKHFTSTYLIPVCCTITVWESLESVSITWNIKHVSGHHKGAFLITDTRGQHFQTLLCCSTNKLGHILQEHVHMLCCFYIFMWNYFCTALPPKILTLYLNQIEKKQGTEREKRSVIHTKKILLWLPVNSCSSTPTTKQCHMTYCQWVWCKLCVSWCC